MLFIVNYTIVLPQYPARACSFVLGVDARVDVHPSPSPVVSVPLVRAGSVGASLLRVPSGGHLVDFFFYISTNTPLTHHYYHHRFGQLTRCTLSSVALSISFFFTTALHACIQATTTTTAAPRLSPGLLQREQVSASSRRGKKEDNRNRNLVLAAVLAGVG